MKIVLMVVVALLISATSMAQGTRVSYGYVVELEVLHGQNSNYRAGGALLGGLLGYWSGDGQSGSNKALRSIGGAALGSAIAGRASSDKVYRYAIHLGANDYRSIVMDRGGLAMGDCVVLEQGMGANVRKVASVFCEREMPQKEVYRHERAADVCDQAKQQVLKASSEEEIKNASLKVQTLCE